MRLKGLKMQGFKSFADNIELSFSDGITAIVGPNGSGKSNISDAVRWVLGEQSAKTLRGSKMEDVIFNGTQTRKRLGFAEVSLRLDNHDRHFNMDFDELVVTRKVFASGEGQYFINDTPCRLKDIHEIFMDTGLGRDGYSMVGQGKIDEILSTKSEDRRQIFEEAAGISKYRYRKEEAERKLGHTDDNLARVSDIIVELETQLEPLKIQAEKAKKYLNLRDQLKTYEVNLALLAVERSRSQGAGLMEKLSAAKEQLEMAQKALSEADSEQEQCYHRFEELDAAITEENDSLKKTEEDVVICQRETDVLKNTIEGNLRLLERIEKELADFVSGQEAARQAIEAEKNVISDKEKELVLIRQEQEKMTAELAGMGEGADVHSETIEKLQGEIAEAFERLSNSKIKLSNLDLTESNLKTRIRGLREDLKNQEAELQKQKNRSGELDAEHEHKRAFIESLEKQLAEKREEEQKLQEKLQEKQREIGAVKLSAEQTQTRMHLLSEMEQNYEGYGKSVKEIMKQHDSGMLKKAAIFGPVSKLIQVEKTYAAAVSAAVGGALQNIVVGTEEDAKEAISCLKKLHAGRATFMPISAVTGSRLDDSRLEKEEGYIGLACDLVTFEKRYDGVVQNLLGKTAVFDGIDNAIRVSRKYKQTIRLVTLEGESFYPGGSMAGGSQQKGSQLLGREQEIKELSHRLDELKKQEATLRREQEAIEKEVLDAAQEQEKVLDVYRENKEVILLLARDKEHYGLLLSGLESAIDSIQVSIQEAEAELLGLDTERENAAKQMAEVEAVINERRAKVNELEEVAEAFSNQKQKLSDALLEKGFHESSIQKDIGQCNEKITALLDEISQTETFISLRKKESEEIVASNRGYEQDIHDKDERVVLLNKAIADKQTKIADLTKERQETEQWLRKRQGDAKDSQKTVFDLKREYDRLEAQKEKLEVEADTALARIWEEYEITYSEAETLRQELGTDTAISRQISSLRGKIRDLGNVNVDAISELETVGERYQFLTTQRDDLQKAKRDLLRIIDEMQSIMKKEFKEKFEQINRHFKSTFTELFGGGSADLELTDAEDVLSCGININVQPPGKKLQSLLLLSGGERALAAIALLFAILQLKPTPFCFLDEIEAALDENNVYRYAEFIKRFSRRTQFILVTHRRGTMESADRIYGVTMQEKGVSKLLELNLEEIEA